MISSVFHAQNFILQQNPQRVEVNFPRAIKDAIWDGSIKRLAEWKPLLKFAPAMMAELKLNPSESNIKNILDCLTGRVTYMPPGFPVYPEQPAAICSIFRRLLDRQFSPEDIVMDFNELWNAIHLIEEFEMLSERRDCPFGEDKKTRLEALYAMLRNQFEYNTGYFNFDKLRDKVHQILMKNWLKETVLPLRALQERYRLSSHIEARLEARFEKRDQMSLACLGIGGSLTFLEGFPGAAYLDFLDLWGNNITSFEGLPDMPELSTLSLDGNSITSFDGLPDMPKLVFLDLQNNEIRSFERMRDDLPSLLWLDLRGNLISSLSGIPFSLLRNPCLEIRLEGCPLDEDSIEAIKRCEFKGVDIAAKIKFGGGVHVGSALRIRSAREASASHSSEQSGGEGV